MLLKKAIATTGILAVLTLGACATTGATSTTHEVKLSQPISQTDARAELIAFNDEFNAISARHDLEGFISLYRSDALWIAPDVPPAAFEGPARETFGFLAQNKGILTHSVDNLEISEDGKLATMIGTAVIKVEAAGVDATGTYLFVMKREDSGNWVILTDMWHQHK